MDELDLVLEQYKEPLIEEQPKDADNTGGETETVKENVGGGIPGETSGASSSSTGSPGGNETPFETWFGNPLYYQSGKKQGQLRGKRKQQAPTVDNSDATISGAVIDGALFLMLIDLLIPFLIQVVNNRFSDVKIKDSDIQLSAEQKRKLEPLADRVVAMMSMKANPVVLLVVAMTSIYGLNFMAAKMDK